MTKKEIYTCDICHTDYVNKTDALKCEKAHCKCVEIKDMCYDAHFSYPNMIKIILSDGTAHWYKK